MPPSSPISLGNLVQLTTIQPKKLNKNNKSIYNGDCILATQKKNFYHQITKKHVLEHHYW